MKLRDYAKVAEKQERKLSKKLRKWQRNAERYMKRLERDNEHLKLARG